MKNSAHLTHHLRAIVVVLALLLPLMPLHSAQAQSFSVLYNFTGGRDGSSPNAGLTIGAGGNFYGTTTYGGITSGSVCNPIGCGGVFKLKHQGSGWVLTPLYQFTGGTDGAFPAARVIIGPDGTLYGTTVSGGNNLGIDSGGVVYRLQPPPHAGGMVIQPWIERVVYAFSAYNGDGAQPYYGDLLFDQAGSIYGTTFTGGIECGDATWCGTVYKLTPNGSGWTETILYAFPQLGVAFPQAGVIFDASGNLYGTTTDSQGAVFQLTPSGGGWAEHTIHTFSGADGSTSIGGLLRDPAGNLYGGTATGGTNGAGVAYQLTSSGGGWTENVIYNFTGISYGPVSSLVRDAAGNLYGTTCEDGTNRAGSVFKLTPSGSQWIETDLHVFTGGSDGSCPWGSLAIDANGVIYGTTTLGGTHNAGVIFQITP